MPENIIQFPALEQELALPDLAPAAYIRKHGHIGLLEAIAWAGSRNARLSSAVYWYQYENPERADECGRAALRMLLGDDLALCGSSFPDAEREFFEGCCDLPALGRFQGAAGFDEVPASVFAADLRVAFDWPDSITLKGRGVLGKPQWSHIRFTRADVLARWPDRLSGVIASATVAADPVKADVVPRAEWQTWVRVRIAAGDTQTQVADGFRDAFAGRVIRAGREDVREFYRAEYQATKGEVRPGPRTIRPA